MNVLNGQIEEIEVSGELSIVRSRVGSVLFSAILIDTPESLPTLKKGEQTRVVFKETEVIIATAEVTGISLRNRLTGKVLSIESDALLSKIQLETEVGKINSIITAQAVKQLGIKKGMEVVAMIKTNEIMLSP